MLGICEPTYASQCRSPKILTLTISKQAITLDGKTVPLERLEAVLRAKTLDSCRHEVRLTPEQEAAYDRVDAVMTILQRVPNLDLGFIGNEAVE